MRQFIKYFWIIALICPILLNVILGFHSPNNIKVIGDSATWLLFYGSYIGGVLTAIIGFCTMNQTSKLNKNEILIAQKRESIKELEHSLAKCVSLFDYSRVGTIALYLHDPTKYNDVLKEMDEYYAKVTTTANAWGIIYSGSEQKEVQEFQDAYKRCVEFLSRKINQVTDLIKKLQAELTEIEREDVIQQITKIIQQQPEYLALQQTLFNKAKQWIIAEKQELIQLQATN